MKTIQGLRLSDLSHVDYLYLATRGSGAISRVKPVVEDLSERSVKAIWFAPSCMPLNVGATLQGETRSQAVNTRNLHLGTPERPGHTHYRCWTTRDFAISPEANAFIRPMIENVFRNEDKPMLETQQSRIGQNDFWSMTPVLQASDAAAVRARRKLAALQEAQAALVV